MDGLHGHGDLSEHPHLVTTVGELGILQVGHFHSKVPHHVVVHQGRGWCGEMRGHEASKGSSFDTKDILFFLIWIPVTHCRINF